MFESRVFSAYPQAGKTDTRFYYYWLSTQTDNLHSLGRGSTFMELSTDELKSLTVPNPPLPQQRAVADYLDRETARLDALVVAKEHARTLLEERRRALVLSAVTRSLDPDPGAPRFRHPVARRDSSSLGNLEARSHRLDRERIYPQPRQRSVLDRGDDSVAQQFGSEPI